MANRSPACQEAHSDPPRAEGTAPPKGTARGKATGTRRGGTGGRPVGCPGGAPCWPRGAGRHGAAVPGPHRTAPAAAAGTGQKLLLTRGGRPLGSRSAPRAGFMLSRQPTLLPSFCLHARNSPLLSPPAARPKRRGEGRVPDVPAPGGGRPPPAEGENGALRQPRAPSVHLERLSHFVRRFR